MIEVRKELVEWLNKNNFIQHAGKPNLFMRVIDSDTVAYVDFRKTEQGRRYYTKGTDIMDDADTIEVLKAFKEARDALLGNKLIERPKQPEIIDPAKPTVTTDVKEVDVWMNKLSGFIQPVASLDQQIAVFKLYEDAKTKLLSDNDILWIGPDGRPTTKGKGHAHIKRSGWRKMARFFGLSCEILSREKIGTEKEYSWIYKVVAKHPGGATQHAEGVASSNDKFFTKGGKVEAKEENVLLKAQTVAFNRAISDLLGGGEISAEEVE